PETFTYKLTFRWTLIAWVGPEGASPGEAIGLGGDQVVAAIRAIYAWDAVTGTWHGYFGAAAPVPGANDLERLQYGRVYWVAIDGVPDAGWTVPLGGAGG
ncbi:MAG TPA: hypothetical protein VJQ83_08830, partial [Tepidiformaceae bacterium]|nr:hypothetical protein [Tepidiformaceae bacterium]